MTTVIIIGASTRAAAMSARRAGLTPWCADLFADADLERIATVRKVPLERYPHGLIGALDDAPPGPVMYTGGLENWPELIATIDRPLWGNPPDVLRAVRDPKRWTRCLQQARLACPEIAREPRTDGRWLLKPRRSAGGIGIVPYAGGAFNPRTHFLQQRLDGVPCSANFEAGDGGMTFLGATLQLVGVPWLHAGTFQYCGSIGPLGDGDRRWRDIGEALERAFCLRGPFGVDAVMREGTPWPIEINPRYTASVEVIERSRGSNLIRGKAIFFARATLAFPAAGPWLAALAEDADFDAVDYADIPHAGEVIQEGRPVLTIFATGATVVECEANLREKAQALDRRLWG